MFSLAGRLGDIHVLGHIGLILALAGTLSMRWNHAVWLTLGISWTPAFGWLSMHLGVGQVLLVRFITAGAGALIFAWPYLHLVKFSLNRKTGSELYYDRSTT